MFILIIILLKCKCGRGELQRRIYRIILVYDSGRKVAKFINPIFSHTPILLRLNPNDNLYSLFSFPSQLATCPPLKEHRRAGGRAISLSKVEISIWMGYMMVSALLSLARLLDKNKNRASTQMLICEHKCHAYRRLPGTDALRAEKKVSLFNFAKPIQQQTEVQKSLQPMPQMRRNFVEICCLTQHRPQAAHKCDLEVGDFLEFFNRIFDAIELGPWKMVRNGSCSKY